MSRRPAGDAIDVHVGKRVRERRMQLAMSQKDLAKAIGVSFQQVQKNERGTNRVGASRMFEISKALDVPVSFFFDNVPTGPARPRKISKRDAVPTDFINQRETQDLIAAYYRIADGPSRKRFVRFLRGLSSR